MAQYTGYDLGKRLARKLKSGAKGAAAGGALGAGLGGPAGLIPGALAGSAAGVLGAGQVAKGAGQKVAGALADNPAETIQSPRYSPEQQTRVDDIMKLLLEMGQGNIQNPNAGFEPIKNNALNDFFQNIVPGIKETFAGIGSSSSPALHTALSGAGAGLAERLAAMQSEYGMQNRNAGLQQLQLGLNPTTENYFQPSSPSMLRSFIDKTPGFLLSLAQLSQQNQSNNSLQQILRNR